MKDAFVKDVMFSLLSNIFSVVLSVLLAKFTYANLGTDFFSVYVFAQVVGSYFCIIFSLGFEKAIVVNYAKVVDKKDLSKLVSFILFYSCLVILLFCVGYMFYVNSISRKETAYPFLVFSFCIVILKNFLSSVFKSMHLNVTFNKINIIFSLFRNIVLLFIVIVLESRVVFSYMLFFSFTLEIIFLLTKLRNQNLEFRLIDYSSFFSVFKYLQRDGLKNYFISIVSSVYTHLDKILMGKYLSITQIGYYNSLYLKISKSSVVTNAIGVSFLPRYLISSNPKDFILRNYKLVLFISIFLGTSTSAFGYHLLEFMFNNEVANAYEYVVFFLSIAYMFLQISSILYNLLIANSAQFKVINLNLVLAVPYVFFMIQALLNYGVLGASIVFMIYSFIQMIAIHIWNRSIFNFKYVLGVVSLVSIYIFILYYLVHTHDFVMSVIFYSSAVLMLLVIQYITFDAYEKRVFDNIVNKVFLWKK